MATAQTIIDRSIRLIGALESGESATAQETADCLVALNALIDSWRNDALIVHAITSVSKTLTPADGSYTIGTGGDINTTWPVKIDGATVTDSASDYPLDVVPENRWRLIQDKSQTGFPRVLYYDPQYPLGVVNLWPVPSSAYTLKLSVWTPIGTLASAATAIALPPGYERALTTALAIEIAPEFQKQVSAELAKAAQNSLALIKRNNVRPILMDIEFACPGDFDIARGY